MGTSACTCHIHKATQQECLAALIEVKSPRAFVSAPAQHWITLVDEDTERFDIDAFERRVIKLSKVLQRDILVTWVYDGDGCGFTAYQRGTKIDAFSTGVPGFSVPKAKSNPKKLSGAFPWWTGAADLEKALKKVFTTESSRIKLIARSFGIPDYRPLVRLKDLQDPRHREFAKSATPDSPFGIALLDQLNFVEFQLQ